ncbi:hypothetical protein [Mycobacterium noviomagense]|uniref:Lipoprotein n=1 Tax=Mycobacterium noviomagense TaxID=459858 RepID=A0A7I7PKD1_9MYCO|nr:hypothetical protein [Mycobacterium noviomagense]ORB15351.1 hypothetical protein BST37_09115 [Mycobacterium noviomagense]BBY08989.1 hypothetical protein MNVI_43070 [Mycobacterium noviomagense]
MSLLALAGLAIAALAFTPCSATDMPGIASFTGSWHAHASRLTINNDGSGRLTYADISACPAACSGHDDYADAPPASVNFMLTSVSGGTATGNVKAASNLSNHTVGEPVTIKLVTGVGAPFTGPPASVSGNNGVALQVSMGSMRDWNFCNDTTHNYCGG